MNLAPDHTAAPRDQRSAAQEAWATKKTKWSSFTFACDERSYSRALRAGPPIASHDQWFHISMRHFSRLARGRGRLKGAPLQFPFRTTRWGKDLLSQVSGAIAHRCRKAHLFTGRVNQPARPV